MGVFTFVCRSAGGEWSAKQLSNGEIEASAPTTFELQRCLVRAALAVDSSGSIASSFSMVTPKSAVFQVIVGGGGGGAFFGGGGGAPGGSAPGTSGGAAAPEAPPPEEKKEEKEESDEDMGFSLFD